MFKAAMAAGSIAVVFIALGVGLILNIIEGEDLGQGGEAVGGILSIGVGLASGYFAVGYLMIGLRNRRRAEAKEPRTPRGG
jgi:hypothetical protein